MKTLCDGSAVEILKVFRNQSNNYKTNERLEFADLIKVRFATGQIGVICSTQLIN